MAEDKDKEEKKEGEEKEASQLELFADRLEKTGEKLDSMSAHVAALAERAATTPPPAPAPAPEAKPARYTEEQVFAAVEKGDITNAQGLALLAKQIREDAKEEARRETQVAMAQQRQHQSEQGVSQKIAAYKAKVPGLALRGSDDWNRVAIRFQELVSEGHDGRNLLTELTAIRDVFGLDPQEEPRERTKERAARTTETTSTSSSRTTAPTRGRKASEPDAELPQDARNYVQKLINLGQYKGWDDPKAVAYVNRYKQIQESRKSA